MKRAAARCGVVGWDFLGLRGGTSAALSLRPRVAGFFRSLSSLVLTSHQGSCREPLLFSRRWRCRSSLRLLPRPPSQRGPLSERTPVCRSSLSSPHCGRKEPRQSWGRSGLSPRGTGGAHGSGREDPRVRCSQAGGWTSC